jgi:hypothetical protein
MTVLVIGVIAADLSAAGAAEQGGLSRRGKAVHQGLHGAAGPISGAVQTGLSAIQRVQGGKSCIMLSAAQGL